MWGVMDITGDSEILFQVKIISSVTDESSFLFAPSPCGMWAVNTGYFYMLNLHMEKQRQIGRLIEFTSGCSNQVCDFY